MFKECVHLFSLVIREGQQLQMNERFIVCVKKRQIGKCVRGEDNRHAGRRDNEREEDCRRVNITECTDSKVDNLP